MPPTAPPETCPVCPVVWEGRGREASPYPDSVAEIQRLLTVYTYLCTVKSMKRRDLERALRRLGWYFLRHGGKHDVWTDGKREEAIPHHTEIHDKLAQAILRRVKGRS